MRSRPRSSLDDFVISCIRQVFASIVVVRGAARDSLHVLFLILLYRKLYEILLMSTAASSGSNDFSPFVRIFIPSSSVLVFCGAEIHHDIDVLKERMVFVVIESFVCRRAHRFSDSDLAERQLASSLERT